ncbi:S-layer homology domain-containing protein [Psychrobacillus sp. INOP01]|uniref:S-layer homology domain-containing protein n=1 Tax=Psychrobacillus sp. INOP01 TaxID=2829187 RepID=UPI001BACE967|nr:S-layer homology domain-containing protein [Psychrobacillus sp. INOP01]QUG42377.1 S-layer homology domain-containing protein [Psychrobacillus sp. INOP01]
MKKRLSMFIMVLALLLFVVPVSAQQVSTVDTYNTTAQFIVDKAPNPSFGDEWFIIALARGEYNVPKDYYQKYYDNVVKHVQSVKSDLHKRKYTEYSRLIIALTAIGKDPTNVGGYNLVEKLSDFDKVVWQGPNGAYFALIALDTWGFELPKTATTTREKLIQHILSKQLPDGGWDLSGVKADPDMTAMAIQALSTYKDRADVNAAINKALDTLKNLQGANGSYQSWGTTNLESVAQVITALASLNIDANKDQRFNKVLVSFFTFYNAKDGGFKHVLTEPVANGMATEQASYTLAAYNRLIAGKTKLYDMSDKKPNKPSTPAPPTKVSFKDIQSHWAKSDIEAAVAKGLLKGYEDNTFRPNNNLTRVQAVSILVRALNLTSSGNAPFTDISSFKDETLQEIAAAYEANLLIVKSNKFSPSSPISREELAVILANAYTHNTGNPYIPKNIAPLNDIGKLSKESQQAITFLHDFEIAQGSNGSFNPTNFITRAHAAKMYINFLKVVEE